MMSDTKVNRPFQKYPYFEEATSVEVVNARMGPDVHPRLREIMAVVVKHLHAAAKEIEPTHEEWLAAIKFLTETGQMCSEWRQEFILLSDTLGVSMLVDAINHRRRAARPRTRSLARSTSRMRRATRTAPTSASTARASR